MPFDPDTDLVREEKLEYTVPVKHCSLCPLSSECLDETGDYIGTRCSITNDYNYFPKCCEGVLKNCPLKKEKCKIVVYLVSEKDNER